MGLRFILGRAGSGKTWTCLEEIRAELRRSPDGPALILVVPEQATFQMERALFAPGDPPGAFRAEVLSFRRLAWRVLGETGGAARPHLDDLGKRLVLRAILERRKQELQSFGRSAGQGGFVEKLALAIRELAFCRVTPEDLSARAEALARRGQERSTLAGKLRDLAVVAGDLREFLKDRYTDPDDYLSLLAERLELSSTIRGARIYVDGFAGFTPQEEAVLEAMMRAAAEVSVALCLDPAEIDRRPEEIDLFHPTRVTHRRLTEAAARAGVRVERPLLLPLDSAETRFSESPALSHLEGQFTRARIEAYPADPTPALALVAAADRRAEVDAAAREIIRLCRDCGYRFRDIAVIVRDLELYETLIVSTFGDYGLPFFIDRRKSAGHHPLVELVRSILETAATDWAPEPLFRGLKTDLLPLDRGDIDRLENYVLAHGIRGRLWSDGQPWTFRRGIFETDDGDPPPDEREELDLINRTRARVVGLLGQAVGALRAAMAAPVPVRRLAQVLFELADSLAVADTLAAWSEEAIRTGDLEGARQQEQTWNGFVGILDRLVEALGEQPMTLTEFAGVVESGLESLRLGLIPPSLDQILVGAIDRSRQPELRAAIILGVNDGVFPAVAAEDSIFTDQDRDELLADGLELGPPARLRSFHEDYLGYIALTRARERLYVSYSLADQEGKPLLPSPLVARLKRLFPLLRPVLAGLDPSDDPAHALDYLTDPRRAAVHLFRRLAEARGGRVPPPFWFRVYRALADRPDRRARASLVARSLVYPRGMAGPLPVELVRRLYGDPLRSSVTRLERFAACPFQHFLTDGLRLEERPIYRVEAPDVGTVFHEALRLFVGRAVSTGIDLAELGEDQAQGIIDQVVDELAPKLRDQILFSSARYRYLGGLLRRTLRRIAGIILEHARRGRFRPVGVEVRFGPDGDWPPLTVEFGTGRLELRGRIDRVDLAEKDGRRFLRVVDYKSGSRGLRLEDLYHGLSLQLLVYLAVAMDNLPGAEPAGLMYMRVQDQVLRVDGPLPEDERERRKLRQMRADGMFLADAEAVRLMDAGASGGSAVIPVRLNADGTVGRGRAAIDARQMEALLRFARRLLRSLGRGIAGGVIRVSPYRRGTVRACTHCRFKGACGFDILLPGHDYRRLNAPGDEIWRRLLAPDRSDRDEAGQTGGGSFE